MKQIGNKEIPQEMFDVLVSEFELCRTALQDKDETMPTDEQLIATMFSFPVWKGATVFEMCKALDIKPDMSPIVSDEAHARSPQVLLCKQMQRLFVGCASPDFGATAFFMKNAQLQIANESSTFNPTSRESENNA